MKNFEKAKAEGWKILTKHPKVDLHASEIRALMDQYDGRTLFEAITDLWLIGLAYGYRMGKADSRKIDSKEGE